MIVKSCPNMMLFTRLNLQ